MDRDPRRKRPSFSSRGLAALSAAAALAAAACTPSIDQESCVISGPPQWSGYLVTVKLPSSLTQATPMWGTKPIPEEALSANRKNPHTLKVLVGENDPQPNIEMGGRAIYQGTVEVDIPVGNAGCTIEAITVVDKSIRVRPTPTAIPKPVPGSRDTATPRPKPQ